MRYLILLIALALASCGLGPEVTTHFETVQEARSKGAFERGWLPPMLPESARNITETNDLDVNMGTGSFQFSASDYASFVSLLIPASPEVAHRDWSAHTAKGFHVFTYAAQDTRWTLALHPRGEGLYAVDARR